MGLDSRTIYTNGYKSQIHFLLNVMSEVHVDRIYVSSFTFRSRFLLYWVRLLVSV